jgi:hypothetical protein
VSQTIGTRVEQILDQAGYYKGTKPLLK